MRQLGTVISFNAGRGFGFVLPDNQRHTIFAHIKDVRDRILLRTDDRISFEIAEDGKGKRCVDIELLEAAATPVNKGGQHGN
jgi:CspA family cold shock protein